MKSKKEKVVKKIELDVNKRPNRKSQDDKYSKPGFMEVRPGKFIRLPTPPRVP